MLHCMARWTVLRRFAREESGATAVEYSLIGVFIAVVVVAAVTALGLRLSAIFTNAAAAF